MDGEGRWFDYGEVVDLVALKWIQGGMLESARYLRTLVFEDDPTESADGRVWISEGMASRASGGLVGALPLDESEDEDSDESADEDEDSDADESSDESEGADGNSVTAHATEHIGGGWYHVTVDGKRKSQSPIQGEEAANEWAAANL